MIGRLSFPSPVRPSLRRGSVVAGWGWGAVLPCGVLAAALAAPVGAQPPVNTEVAVASVRSVDDDAATLKNLRAETALRAAAADRLLANPAPESRAVIQEVLSSAPPVGAGGGELAGPDPAVLLLQRIAALPAAPPWVLSLVVQSVAGVGGVGGAGGETDASVLSPRRRAAIDAAGSIRTRDSVKWLIDQARESSSSSAATASLIRLTGRAEFGGDVNRWALWYSQVQWVSEAEWRRDLAESLAARADELAAQRGVLLDRVLAAVRKSYFATESLADRSAMLAGFLGDALPEVRSLGLSLAKQELANARRLEPGVSAAALKLLADPKPAVRRDAAELVTILAPGGGGAEDRAPVLIAEALRKETDAEVAALLLRASARWPDASLAAYALSWLEAGHHLPTAVPACELLDALRESAPDTLASIAPRLAGVLRDFEPGADLMRLPAPCLRLLFTIGEDADREKVAGLLGKRDGDPAARQAAAAALASLPGAVEPIVAAARTDPALFSAAARALTLHRPSIAGFRLLAQLPCDDPDVRRDGLLSFSRLLTHNDLYRIASGIPDAGLREAMLARLLTEPLASQFSSPSQRTTRPGVIAGLLLLYNTRVELGRPSGALAVVDALTPVLDRDDQRDQDNRRTEVLLWLNRIDEASHLKGTLGAWLMGLRRCIGLPHAREVLAAIDARFGGNISGEEAEQLAALRMAVENGPNSLPAPSPANPPAPDGQR